MAEVKEVLLVEDHTLVSGVLDIVLRRRGFNVLKAATGEEAIQLIDQRLPSLLITDLDLPGISGLEVIAHLRSLHRTARILAMSGRGSRLLAEALVKGADLTLKKPFTTEALTEALNRL